MPTKVLVIGEAFVNEVRLLSRSGLALASAQQATIIALDDAQYDVRHVEFYLGFEIIIAPYRMCVLHLALQREARPPRPFIILATDATHNTNRLVDGHVCEEVVDSETGMKFIRGLVAGDDVTLAAIAERRRGQVQRDVETVSPLARVQFLSYLGRGAHGRRWWSHPSDGEDGIDEYEFQALRLQGRLSAYETMVPRSEDHIRAMASAMATLQDQIVACRERRFSVPAGFYEIQQKDFAPRWHDRDEHHLPAVPLVKLSTAARYATDYYAHKCEKNMNRHALLTVKPVFGRPAAAEDLSIVDRAFMLMPFTEELTRLYTDVIRPTAERCGMRISRADDFFSAGAVMNTVWTQLNEADIVLADVTGRNPNVFYELGIAHTLGKPVILLAQDMADVPFDIRHLRIITYGLHYNQIGELTDRLTKAFTTVREEIETDRGFVRVG